MGKLSIESTSLMTGIDLLKPYCYYAQETIPQFYIMRDARKDGDAAATPSKEPSLEERLAKTKERIEVYSSMESYSHTANMVVGATLTEWEFSPDGMLSMFQPLNQSEIQARLDNARTLARRWDRDSSEEEFEEKNAKEFRDLEETLQTKFAILRSGELPLSDDRKMVFENVMIDSSGFGMNQVVGGTVRVVKKHGEQYTTDSADDDIGLDKPDDVLALQFTDRQPNSRAGNYPQYDFNGKNLNGRITSDHCPAMAVLAEKWKEAMLLYLQATLDLREKQQAQKQQQREQITADAKQQLVDIGLSDF